MAIGITPHKVHAITMVEADAPTAQVTIGAPLSRGMTSNAMERTISGVPSVEQTVATP